MVFRGGQAENAARKKRARVRTHVRVRDGRAAGSAKAVTGIAGLDEAMHGGLPRGRTTIVFGGPGSGKTVLALQALVNGARVAGEAGIFVAFEENSQCIVANAASFGWNLTELQKRKLFFFDAALRPNVVQAGKFDLIGVLQAVGAKVKELGARRVVFDGIDVLLTLLADPAAERAELCRIHEWLIEHELTGILTAKASGTEPFSHLNYAFAAYMADCALILTRRHHEAVSEREITILKYRGSAFSENKAPFVIGPAGIEVAEQLSGVDMVAPSDERLSTGVARLDAMLKGGFLRASTTLITGLPGTAKSNLCGAFVRAACTRRERVLFVSFDEHSAETVRNLLSIGVELQPFLDSGLLRMQSSLSRTESAEVQFMRIRAAIREHRATCIVVDPISALSKSSHAPMALGVLARFVHWIKVNRITMVSTSLLSGPDPHMEATELGASTLCDTWIHLAYAQRGGERNRALSIIKSRGTGHSNQVRELILTDEGVTLASVYESGGEVLMGTMRWERENARRDEATRLEREAQKRRVALERTRAELSVRRAVLEREIDLNELELDAAAKVEADRRERESTRHEELMRQRGADAVNGHAKHSTAQRLRRTKKGTAA